MKHLINFSHKRYQGAQKQNCETGLNFGGFDTCTQYKYEDIDSNFQKENNAILNNGNSRGAGFWLWKPYFILKTLKESKEGDIVFYSDSGANFYRDVSPLIDQVLSEETGLGSFHLAGNLKESQWNKRVVMQALGLDNEDIRNSLQRMASFIIAKKCKTSISIIEEWLTYSKKPELICDGLTKVKNYPEFHEHRHDQSIWSLICKKHKIKLLPDPTQFGYRFGTMPHEEAEANKEHWFIHHHRLCPGSEILPWLESIRKELDTT